MGLSGVVEVWMWRTAVFLLMISILLSACAYGQSSAQQPIAQPWPNGQRTLVSTGGAVFLTHIHQDLAIILDKSHVGRTRNVVVSAVDLPAGYLIETNDPQGRYQPSVAYAKKDDRPLLKIDNLQIPISISWNTQVMGPIDLNQLKLSPLGTTTIAQLPDFLSDYRTAGGINLLLPMDILASGDGFIDVYQTAGALTFVVLPSSQAALGGGGGLMALAQSEPIVLLAISTQIETLHLQGLGMMVQ